MPTLHRFSFFAMGTQCELQLYARSESAASAAAQRAIDEVARIEAKYSRYRDDSALSAINRKAAQGLPAPVDEETAALLDYACACHEKSHGLFDITSGVLRKAWDFSANRLPAQSRLDALLPLVGLNKLRWERPHLSFDVPGMEIDFGGIAKEYAADQAAAVCVASGIAHGLVELGGDINVIGPHPNLQPWIIGIRHPQRAETVMTTVAIARGALASSGDYERYIEVDGTRYCHILDPRTGWPVRGLSSVSVSAGQCLVAGTVATIALLKGDAGKQWLTESGLAHVWMDAEENSGGNIHAESQDRGHEAPRS